MKFKFPFIIIFICPLCFKFSKYNGAQFFVFMFFRNNESYQTNYKHEYIHYLQTFEMLIIPFWILYLIYAIKYKHENNPFELDAEFYKDKIYIRQMFAWKKFL